MAWEEEPDEDQQRQHQESESGFGIKGQGPSQDDIQGGSALAEQVASASSWLDVKE